MIQVSRGLETIAGFLKYELIKQKARIDLLREGRAWTGFGQDKGGKPMSAPGSSVPRQRASVGKISAKCCSFSAVSAPIFASKNIPALRAKQGYTLKELTQGRASPS